MSSNVNTVMDVIFWLTSSSGDEWTKRFSPNNLRSFHDFCKEHAETVGFSVVETLMLFTEILMTELVSNIESFDNTDEWLTALGEYWAAETARWQAAMLDRLTTVNPALKVSIMVYTAGRPREVKPTDAESFKHMIDNDRVEIFRNDSIQAANRL